jgi:hypothetical protein
LFIGDYAITPMRYRYAADAVPLCPTTIADARSPIENTSPGASLPLELFSSCATTHI